MSYKIIFEINFVLYFFVSSLWHCCLFFSLQKVGDCDLFRWANDEMSTYEKKLMEHLKNMEERR